MTTRALTVKYLREESFSKDRKKFIFCTIREGAQDELFAVESFDNGDVGLYMNNDEDLVSKKIDLALGLMEEGSNFETELKKALSLEAISKVNSASFKITKSTFNLQKKLTINAGDKKEIVLRQKLPPIYKSFYRHKKLWLKFCTWRPKNGEYLIDFKDEISKKKWDLFKFDDKREIEKFGAYIQQVLEIKENANLEKLSKSVFPYFFSWKDISYFLNCSYALCEFCNYWSLGAEIRGYLFKNY